MKLKLLYFYDALCGWCYGFSPVIKQLYETHGEEIDFEVISGGMVLGERVGPIGKVAPYIKDGFRKVEEVSGVKFGETFLKDLFGEGETIFTSMPASIAMTVFKQHRPEKAVLYAHDLQRAIYFEGTDPSDWAAFAKLANQYEIDEAEFAQQLEQPGVESLAYEDFVRSREFGITGYPALVGEKEGKYYLLAQGFTPYEQIEERVKSLA